MRDLTELVPSPLHTPGISGHGIAGILGVSPWTSPLQVWLRSTKPYKPEPATEAMQWGLILEPVIANKFATDQNVELWRPFDDGGVALATKPHIRCTLDYLTRKGPETSKEEVVEVKTTSVHSRGWGEPGTPDVPQQIWLQGQWQCGITGCHIAWVPTLRGGQRYGIYRIESDTALFQELLDIADQWWEKHVIGDLPPDPDADERWASYLAERYPGGSEVWREPEDDELELVEDLRLRRIELAKVQEACAVLENRLRLAIGDDRGLQLELGRITLSKASTRTSTKWTAAIEAIREKAGWSKDQMAEVLQPYQSTSKQGRRLTLPGYWTGEE